MSSRKSTLRVAVGILLVKDRIQQYFAQCAQLERGLNDFKRKHSYCIGRPFCMNMVSDESSSCNECLKANQNPRYKKKLSAYGVMRRDERAEERTKKVNMQAKKKTAAKHRRAA